MPRYGLAYFYRLAAVFWLVLAMLIGSLSAVRADEVPTSIHVLLYHRFDEPEYETTNISSSEFKAQIAFLKHSGYRFLSLTEFQNVVSGRTPWPQERTVLVTIDDPYRSVFQVAAPILRQAKIPWALAVNTEPLEDGWPGFMTWDDVERLAKEGVAILNHGHAHIPWEGSVAAVRDDRVKAAELLRRHGIEPQGVVYPYGRYDAANLKALRQAGEHWGFTQDPGGVGPKEDDLLIPRMAMIDLTLHKFREQLVLRPLATTGLQPAPGAILPADRRVRGRILHPERFEGGLNLFVSGLGAVAADYDFATGEFVSAPLPPFVRPVTRIKISLKIRGISRFALDSWRVLENGSHEKGPPEGGP